MFIVNRHIFSDKLPQFRFVLLYRLEVGDPSSAAFQILQEFYGGGGVEVLDIAEIFVLQHIFAVSLKIRKHNIGPPDEFFHNSTALPDQGIGFAELLTLTVGVDMVWRQINSEFYHMNN